LSILAATCVYLVDAGSHLSHLSRLYNNFADSLDHGMTEQSLRA